MADDFEEELEAYMNDIVDVGIELRDNPGPLYHAWTSAEFSVSEERSPAVGRSLVLVPSEWEPFSDGSRAKAQRIIDALDETFALLEDATDYSDSIDSALERWRGGASRNFQTVFLDEFKSLVRRQGRFIAELGSSAVCYKEILVKGQKDALSLAEELKGHVTLSYGGSIELTTVLSVAGAVAGGVVLATGGPFTWAAAAAWVTSATVTGINAVESLSRTAGPPPSLQISPTVTEPEDMVLSVYDRVDQIKEKVSDQILLVDLAIQRDIADVGPSGPSVLPSGSGPGPFPVASGSLIPRRPELLDLSDAGELGQNQDDEDIASEVGELWFVGEAQLPAVAFIMNKAYEKIGGVIDEIDSAYEGMWMPGHHLRMALELLEEGLKKTRDFLSEAGEKLIFAARTYDLNEAQSEEVLDVLNDAMDDFERDRYLPNRVDPRGGLNAD